MAATRSSPEGVPTFGRHYAVLNLDLMTVLIDAVKDTEAGKAFISNCSRWNDAVHKKQPQPLTVFTSLCFGAGEPELAKCAPFTKLLQGFGSFEIGSPPVQVSSEFTVGEKDVVLQKTRWYAGAGNGFEQVLRAQNIDTVIISGLSLSGVVMSTIYRLFDLDYNVYVIRDNVLELPPGQHPEVSRAMLDILLPKMNLRAISIDDALEALEMS
ncbi:hypothetical protein VUR80DRAFT_2089 [Thermomyces stellatus]